MDNGTLRGRTAVFLLCSPGFEFLRTRKTRKRLRRRGLACDHGADRARDYGADRARDCGAEEIVENAAGTFVSCSSADCVRMFIFA